MTGGGGPITPAPQANSATPAPLPSAFAQTNTFTFAAAPSNNYADPNAPPQIFFIQVQPTLVKNGRPVTLSAITTTNVTSLSFGPSSTATQFTLASIGPGKWQSTFNFSTNGLADLVGNATETLTAATALGASAKQSIPFTVVPH